MKIKLGEMPFLSDWKAIGTLSFGNDYEKTLIVKDGVYAVFDQTIKYLNQDEIKAVLKSKGVKQWKLSSGN